MNDSTLIRHISLRAVDLLKRAHDVDVPPEYIASELWLVHDSICRLLLQQLLDADDYNFAHDIGGIHRHLDVAGMTLRDCFVPRFAVRQ